jgi:hypothetical protein
MSIIQLRKVKTDTYAEYFSNQFYKASGALIPYKYFKTGKTFLFFNRRGLIGGFSFIRHNKRTIAEIPDDYKEMMAPFLNSLSKNSVEITGYFIVKNQKPFLMVTHFL